MIFLTEESSAPQPRIGDCLVMWTLTKEHTGHSSVFQGDSGSGVIRTSPIRDVEEIVGVLSAGMPCPELYETHRRESARHMKLTQETDLLIDIAHHLEFFCTCCGLC